ncbi:glycoside hydrolase [Phellopilus nigrolimitatus]|nr:glycoside hydrolase [Phellopilus nigrolimitatus]
MSSSPSSFLRVEGAKIVNGEGREVVLRGAGLGGWMTMENFISGYPGCEFQIREALVDVLGETKAEFFFDKFLEYFFTERDAEFFKMTANPRVLKPEGFKHLNRVVEACAKHGIYTILDLHTCPGGQNGGWHCDSGVHLANFWTHKDFQDRAIWLWEQLAEHYKNNAWIAGYNPMNEPADARHTRLVEFYDRMLAAVRSIDPHHALFLDGNTYATDFSRFPEDAGVRWPNCAYAIHDYSVYGFPSAPESYTRTPEQQRRMRRSYEKKREWMDARSLCVWNGEWGPVYARKEYEGDKMDEINDHRYMVLKDQLEIYQQDQLSWSIWLYKDIGFQGMVYVPRDTPYMRLLSGFLAKKHRLAIDSWGADDTAVRAVYEPLVDLIKANVSDKTHLEMYPYPVLARSLLLGEIFVLEWAEHFRGKTEEELDELAQSFKFQNCVKREGLNRVLTEHAEQLRGL